MVKSLSSPVALNKNNSMLDHLNSIYHVFEKYFLYDGSGKIGVFNNKDVKIDLSKDSNGEFKILTHLIGYDENNIFNEESVLPCNNDAVYIYCNENCITRTIKLGDKYPCLYRGNKIHWILDIIKLADNHDPRVVVFGETRRDRRRNRDNHYVHLRYQSGRIDYNVLLKKFPNYYLLITSYPVVYPRKKKELNKKYDSYQAQTRYSI